MRVRTLLPLALGLAGTLGLSSANADPFNTDAISDEVAYESSLNTYSADEDHEPGNWVAANQRVGEIDGWRTYLRQAQEPVEREASTSETAPHSMPGMHPQPAPETK